MPKANTFNLLFYGFNFDQAKKFDSLLNGNSFHITNNFPDRSDTAPLVKEERILTKNLIEIQGTKDFKEIYSDVLRFYREKEECLPYEKIDSYNLSNNLILSSVHLTTRGFLNSTDDSIRHFRQTFNLAVYLIERFKFKIIIMRTGPQSMLSNLIFNLSYYYNYQVIYGEPINYGPHRWMLSNKKKGSISSGLSPNLEIGQINSILDNIFLKKDLSPDRSMINSLGLNGSSFKLFIKILNNLALNILNIGYRFIAYTYYFLRNYFNKSKNYFAYGKDYPSRIYWKAHLKDLLKSSFLHFYYSFNSFLDWNKFNKDEKFVVLLGNYQPEKTSNPDSMTYFDLRNLAESVKIRINQDVKIIYKEHPSTLFRLMKENFPRLGTLYRSIDFYKDLKDLGIILSPIEIDTQELMLNSRGVYCLTSTAILNMNIGSDGKDSISNIPINVFGDRWFSKLNKVSSFEDDGRKTQEGELSLRDLLFDQLSNGFYTTGEPGAYSEEIVHSIVPEIKRLLKNSESN